VPIAVRQGNRFDVTCRVQSMVQNGYLTFRVTNYSLGGEQAKEFRIRARDYRGRIFEYFFPEKQDVNLHPTDRGADCPNTGTNVAFQGRLNDDD
jgi:hypothetical protein